jgi:hypothetical protein
LLGLLLAAKPVLAQDEATIKGAFISTRPIACAPGASMAI